MNLLERLAAWLRAIWAVARGYDIGNAAPVPQVPASLRPDPGELVAEAARQGSADAASGMMDSWLFGGPTDEVSGMFDPPYVNQLRSRCAAAVAASRVNRATVADRLAHVRQWRDESVRDMEFAREAMGNVAVREAWMAGPAVVLAQRREPDEPDQQEARPEEDPNRNASDRERVWEGESRVLGVFWRAAVLLGLTAAETIVLQPVLAAATAAGPEALLSAIAVSALMVGAPYLAALVTRGRRATGAEGQIWYVVALLGAAWLMPAMILGMLQGERLAAAASTLAPLTVIALFFALLIIIGVMAFMLGLARRHPFQEAYVRHRTTRNNLDVLHRAAADRIGPGYVEEDPAVTAQQDQAIRETFAAAEYAYFAALVQAVGDPTFTEAVQNRRGLRPPLPDGWADGGDPEAETPLDEPQAAAAQPSDSR